MCGYELHRQGVAHHMKLHAAPGCSIGLRRWGGGGLHCRGGCGYLTQHALHDPCWLQHTSSGGCCDFEVVHIGQVVVAC